MPDGTNEKIIKRLIGLIHLVGVNQWAPFEADGYYYREVEDLRNEEKETLANACKIVSKIYFENKEIELQELIKQSLNKL